MPDIKKLLEDFTKQADLNKSATSLIPFRSPSPMRSLFSGNEIADNMLGKLYRTVTSSRISHAVLDQHTAIAWDMDDTLINGPQSWFWRRWIQSNHANRKFCILTYRTAHIDSVWQELEQCTDPVSPEWFQSVIAIPKILWSEWSSFPSLLREIDTEEKMTPILIDYVRSKYSYLNIRYMIEVNRAVRSWKAVECKQRGYSLLVEDREQFCKPYCDLLKIKFLNALTG